MLGAECRHRARHAWEVSNFHRTDLVLLTHLRIVGVLGGLAELRRTATESATEALPPSQLPAEVSGLPVLPSLLHVPAAVLKLQPPHGTAPASRQDARSLASSSALALRSAARLEVIWPATATAASATYTQQGMCYEI